MKKILSPVVSAILAAIIVPSCVTREQDVPYSDIPGLSKEATLTMGFCAPGGASTRAGEHTEMADQPVIESIHVFIFDEEGTLLQVRKANLGEPGIVKNYDNTNPDVTTMVSYWTIDNVSMSVEKRVLHFVANLSDERVPKTGSESSIFRSLSVEYPCAAYWQRIELDNGIRPYSYDGSGTYSYIDESGVLHQDAAVPGTPAQDGSYQDHNGFTVNADDYIDIHGDKILNGTGYFYVPESGSPLLQMIPMVRNFVKITFVNNWDKFSLQRIALVNTPQEGLVAPYNPEAPDKFESEYLWSGAQGHWSGTPGDKPDHNEVGRNGYAPLLPAAGISSEPVPAGLIYVSNESATLYMYERGLPDGNATSLLIGGFLTPEDGESIVPDDQGFVWFRIEIVDDNKDYYNFYRNFEYEMRLNSIANAAAICHSSAEDALSHIPVGDISNTHETETLTQINDGDGFYLWVNYVDYQHLGEEQSVTVPLIYTLFYDDNGTLTYYCADDPGTAINEDCVTFTPKRNMTIGATAPFATDGDVIKRGVISETQNSDYLSQVPNRDYEWYLAEVTLKPGSSTVLRNDVEVYGHTTTDFSIGYHKVTRLVTYTVVGKQKLDLSVTPISDNSAGKPFTLTVTLPNTLARSSFPLSLKIEAEDNNITPVDHVKAELGKSSFDSANDKDLTYFFVKTIEYSEYVALDTKSFTFNFLTTKDSGHREPATASDADAGAKHVTRIKVTEYNNDEDAPSWFLSDDGNATCELWSNPAAVTGVSLNKDKAWIVSGTSEKLIATIQPRNASELGLTWTSSNPSVATVDAEGTVTAVSVGKTNITVTTVDGGYSAICEAEVYVPVTSIVLYDAVDGDPSTPVTSLNLPYGNTAQFAASVLPAGATYHDELIWTSSNTAVATVSDEGLVTAIGPGAAVITVSAADGSGVSASCTVHVRVGVTDVTLNKHVLNLVHHDSERLLETVLPTLATNKGVTWSSTNENVATVGRDGTVTAVGVGTAKVTVTTNDGGFYDECAVTVNPKLVTNISLNKTSMTINRWATEMLTTTVTPSDATNTGITWSSSDDNVATVDQNGLVTAVNGGTAVISVSASDDSGVTATCEVTVVYVPVQSVSITDEIDNPVNDIVRIPLGENKSLKAAILPVDATKKNVTWESSNPSVATVDENGVIRASSTTRGDATITVTSVDDPTKYATCTVRVFKPMTGMTLNTTSTTIYVKMTEQLNVVLTPSDASLESTVWSSDDPSVAAVDQNGVVTAVAAGTAEITATVSDGVNTFTKKCIVTVTGTVTFNTYRSGNGDYANSYNDATNTKTHGLINLKFADRFYQNPGTTYVTVGNTTYPTSFTVSGTSGKDVKIKTITITYTASNYNGGNDSYADPQTASTVHGGNGTTGTWTGESESVTIYLYRENGTSSGNRPRISSIVVEYE